MTFFFYLIRKFLPVILVLLLGIFVWKRCKDTLLGKPDEKVQVTHNTILTKIEDLGKMELVRYNFKDVVEYKKEISRWLPDSKTVLIVAGEAVGCIDMKKVNRQDITFPNDSTIIIKLPDPEICYFKIDHDRSKVYDIQNTYFRDAELVDDSYKFAEKNVRAAALNSGILEQTADNANKILRPMLEAMTGKQVILIRKQTTAAPVLPRRD
ncbi:DUF4230 domain-containing protein [Adhaeribacter aquaticus]|uniref:DUF4230 domain-containing protein n=1 Tax=Adhaeribacter aquaticus TaxID=299567 RepID=UPI00047B8F43|nr:DUF4230 domain-containing protein [Adhaeribacter aquaticus]